MGLSSSYKRQISRGKVKDHIIFDLQYVSYKLVSFMSYNLKLYVTYI